MTSFGEYEADNLLGLENLSPTPEEHEEQQHQPRPLPWLMPSLLGTWTLQTHVKSDLGLYQLKAYLVMHIMADPLQAYSCKLPNCNEQTNHICQRNLDECVDIQNSISQWSDVSVFYNFGFEADAGTYPWRVHAVQNSSDWLGPYNMIVPQHSSQLDSRYVATIATDYLKAPVNQTLVSSDLFDGYAGATAVHNSIQKQTSLNPRDDPHSSQLETCQQGDMHPMLPRFTLDHNRRLQFDFLMSTLPTTKDSMYKNWASLEKHLPDDFISGPYCFQGDPHRAYAVNVSFDSTLGKSNKWKLTTGCVDGLPCWPTEHGPKPHGGGGGGDGAENVIFHFFQSYGVYVLLVALMISMTLNCQWSYQLQQQNRLNDTRRISASTRRARSTGGQEETSNLQEPLLPSDDEVTETNHLEHEKGSETTEQDKAESTTETPSSQTQTARSLV